MTELSFDLISKTLPENTTNIFIAYSGGIDSHVLLHLCASNPKHRQKITAVYVHHGLQQEADDWSLHCHKIAVELGVGFRSLKVNAQPGKRQSPEEAARVARYDAFRKFLAEDDVLLVAQHQEDQLETFLLQLFRGAGVQGLAAMPVSTAFGRGQLLRPLLNTEKKAIDRYAGKHSLQWMEDPSNQANDYDRNYLRNKIVPLLRERWPALDKTVGRSAKLCAAADQVLTDLADDLLNDIYVVSDQTLKIEALMRLSLNRRNLVLRRWFAILGLRPPSETALQKIIEEVIAARVDADPEVRIQGYLIKRFQGRLYCISANNLIRDEEQEWPNASVMLQRSNDYVLKIVESEAGIPIRLWQQARVTVRLRIGGELIALPGRQGRHTLKKMFQESAVPPWQRKLIPLIYLDDDLAAVAGIWISAEYYSSGVEPCYWIEWIRNE